MTIKELIKCPGPVSIDSRTLKKGEIFLAVKGKNFDGNDFAEEALKKGASFAVVSKKIKVKKIYKNRVVRVKNTITALADMARTMRESRKVPVVAITGSSGKTTAKELAAHVLSARYRVLKNKASENSDIGLPLTLLRLKKCHDVVVLEMGTRKRGEIARLSDIARPTMGAITNIGPSHLEFLKSLKNVFLAKTELIKNLPKRATLFLNKDDVYLSAVKGKGLNRVYFSIKRNSEYRATDIKVRARGMFFKVKGIGEVSLPMIGRHNIYNALLGIAIGRMFNVPARDIKEKLRVFHGGVPKRMEIKKEKGIFIIDDSYNSNPVSMKCALSALGEHASRGKKMIVLGDMLELGPKTKEFHCVAGKLVAESPVETLITLGKRSFDIHKAAKRAGMKGTYHAKTHDEAAAFMKQLLCPGDVVLIKGSRSMEMERTIELFSKL